MSNRVLDSGFELAEGAVWAYNDQAQQTDSVVYEGSYSAMLTPLKDVIFGTPINLTGNVAQTIDVSALEHHDVRFRFNPWSMDTYGKLKFQYRHAGLGDWQTHIEISKNDYTDGAWSLVEAGSIYTTSDTLEVRFYANQSANGSSILLVDSVEVDDMGRGLFDGRDALLTVLANIAGSPYWNNLGSRIYNRLIVPGPDAPEIQKPYACVPFMGDPVTHEDMQRGYKFRWLQPVYIYVADGSSDRRSSDAPEAVAKAHDDMTKLLTNYPDLDGAVHSARVVGARPTGGWKIDSRFGEIEVMLEITQMGDNSDLGQ